MTIETESEEVASPDERDAAALAIMAGIFPEEAAFHGDPPAKVVETPAPTEEPEAKPVDPLADDDRLRALAQKSLEAREAEAASRAAKLEADARQKSLDEREAALEKRLAKLEAFERDPLASVEDPRKHLERLQKLAMNRESEEASERATNVQRSIEARLEQMQAAFDAKLAAIEESGKSVAQAQAERVAAEGRANWIRYVEQNAEKAPYYRVLDAETQIAEASEIATRMRDSEEPVDFARILAIVEAKHARQASLYRAVEPATAGAESDVNARTQPGRADPTTPSTLSSEHAAASTESRLASEEERDREAEEMLRRLYE